MRKRWGCWNTELMHGLIIPVTKQYLRQRLGKSEDENIEVGVAYPLVKNILGVSIEEGTLRLFHVQERFLLAMLQDLIGLEKHADGWRCIGANDIVTVEHWAKRLDLEPVDVQSAEGYAINHELVEWISQPFSGIQIKYRSARSRLLVMYYLFFLISHGEYYIIIEQIS
ncbi:hypothetical protein [Thermospira aquatica]|uniref:Uncharacterized protein n=1 Tax=Thermospira aquatica TaxID=2828656 RepID=A0AAX3BDE1_9SPIR|nr:hypothetical protein [Thermospira aquatica]URA10279.1 hypothetical protein KDW03_00290 [Thermospira aquatica]